MDFPEAGIPETSKIIGDSSLESESEPGRCESQAVEAAGSIARMMIGTTGTNIVFIMQAGSVLEKLGRVFGGGK